MNREADARQCENHQADKPFGDLDPEVFRAYGKQIVDWIADYLSHPEQYPVLSQVKPGEVKAQLPSTPPDQSETLDVIPEHLRSL